MHSHNPSTFQPGPASRRAARQAFALLALGLVSFLSGCVSFGNPVANGVPVRRLPPDLFAASREGLTTLPLSLLKQKPPDVYRLGSGDVLGVWIEGILGERTQLPPVHFPEAGNLPPAMGFPIPVREDGTIPLPLVPPLKVEGLTEQEATDVIKKAYTVDRQLLPPGRDRIIVTLIRRRVYRVLVIRQESGGAATAPGVAAQSSTRQVSFSFGATGGFGSSGRSQGFAVDLPAYENDVLNALAQTGGLPGFESNNEILIERGSYKGTEAEKEKVLNAVDGAPPGCNNPLAGAGLGGPITRIPMRLRPGERPPFTPEDIVLNTGDIIYIQARQADLFYAGGLLPPGEYQLPRDYDLDVLEAVVRMGGPLVSSLNANNINGAVTGSGIGSPSPSLLTVLRKTPGGGQVPIKVDLNLAFRDPRERLVIQAGDVLILQEKPSEALVRYFNQTFFNFNLLTRVISGNKTNATINLHSP